MRNFMEKLKEFIYYLVCKELPATEYAVGAVDSLDDTITIMKKCSWTFSFMEAAKLFFSRYAETAICIAITGILWASYGEQMATTLFYAFDMPNRVYEKDEFWLGNHKYVKAYRDKMTHRNSPNVVTISSYAIELRMPMRYVLKRVIEDYAKASEFIKLMLEEIISGFDE